MSLLDSISEMVLNFLVKIGLYHKDSPAAEFEKPRPEEEEPYAEYVNVPLSVRQAIHESSLSDKYDPECDIIIKNLIKNKERIETIMFSEYRLFFKFENGTTLSFWIANLWYSFMTDIEIQNRNRKNKSNMLGKQPSKQMMVDFLNTFYKEIRYEKDHLCPPIQVVKEWISEDYFTFKDKKKKEESNDKSDE